MNFGYTGMYKSLGGAIAFVPVAILINVGVVVWGLMKTRDEGRGYGGQVGAALVMALVASAIIFPNALLFTGVLFPQYFEEIAAVQTEMLQAAGTPEADIEAARQQAASQTDMQNALAGVIGTLGTTLVVALIAAIFIRDKTSRS